jgi:fibronectin-binding autotransporter adhesin
MKIFSRNPFHRISSGALLAVSAFAVLGGSLQAGTSTKANNTDDLDQATSWFGGVPGAADVALWNSTVTGANTVSLGAPIPNWGSIQITNPGGPVTINGAGILALHGIGLGPGVGIDMSSSTADLTINANVSIADSPPSHIWTVAADRTLTVNGNVSEDGPANKTLTIGGAGLTRITGIIGNGENDLSVAKNGSGTLILTNANQYGGDTTVNQGVLNIRDSAALGTAAGNTIVNSGGELQLQGNISIAGTEDISVTGIGAGGFGGAAIRNISGDNQFNGDISLQDAAGVVRINADAGSLTFLGKITEVGTSLKILSFGGSGNVIASGPIGGGNDLLALAKDGTGTLTLSGNNTYQGTTVVRGGNLIITGSAGNITQSVSITINNGALTMDDTVANRANRIGNRPVTMNNGTFNLIHGAPAGTDYIESIGAPLTLNSGASTIRTDASNTANSSLLSFGSLVRNAGATVNFGDGTSNPSAANDDNNVRFSAQAAGFIGTWATVGGTSFATYNTASATDSVEALTTYEQTVTRLSSGTKSITDNSINNVQITDGTGTVGNITLGQSTTTINTLTNSATGIDAPAGGVTIDPAGQTLRVNGILNASGSSALTIGNGTSNGTLTANTAGGELVLLNFSSNALTVNSTIANNSTSSPLTTGGSGSVIVTAANTYSGGTIVNQGMLEISGTAGALANTSSMSVNTGGTLHLNSSTAAVGGQVNDSAGATLAGGTIQLGLNAIDETVGALTITNDSIIDFGILNGINHLRFSDSTGLWTSGMALNILNYTYGSDHLYFGTVTDAGVDAGQLAQINFFSGGSVGSGFLGTGIYLENGEVGLIPEPSSVAMVGLGSLALLGFRKRRCAG